MYIARFQVANYKSFRETKPLEFAQGFNIISGQNNSGKTALLEMLGLRFTGHPHRSIKTIPARDTVPPQFSRAIVSFTVSPNELKKLMLASPGQYLGQALRFVVQAELTFITRLGTSRLREHTPSVPSSTTDAPVNTVQ